MISAPNKINPYHALVGEKTKFYFKFYNALK